MSDACRVCRSTDTLHVFTGRSCRRDREYRHCRQCDAVTVPDRFLFSPDEECARYLTHRNSRGDPGYVEFLRQLLDELVPMLEPGSHGLDFGSGPEPVLAQLMSELGFDMSIYDLYFAPDLAPLGQVYDFITCTEVAEHFRDPLAEFARMDRALKPGGILGVMTCMPEDWSGFSRWRYRSDETHICFYSLRTMAYIAETYGWDLSESRTNVVLFHQAQGPH